MRARFCQMPAKLHETADVASDENVRVRRVDVGCLFSAKFGSDVPMKRAGEPEEIAPSYVFLACDDSAYMTGQVLHPNGGEIVNG